MLRQLTVSEIEPGPSATSATIDISSSQPTVPNMPLANIPPAVEPSRIFAVTLPSNMTVSQQEVETNCRMLYRATVSMQSSQVSQILLNLELMAFGIRWFGQVC
jgi:hypothetical protein